MRFMILGLLAETALHPGTGQDSGIVDLPVARESLTGHPVVFGTSLKGALRDHFLALKSRDSTMLNFKVDDAFGRPDQAGDLVVGDARLLLLPVRSLSESYRWVTCPLNLERLGRDLERGGFGRVGCQVPTVSNGEYLGAAPTANRTVLVLEERQFARLEESIDARWIEVISRLILHSETQQRLPDQLAILSNTDFAWFAKYGLPVNARNVLDPVTKSSKNLWYEETLPMDSLFSVLIGDRRGNQYAEVVNQFRSNPYLQFGGNETVGQGWTAVSVLESAEVNHSASPLDANEVSV